MCSVRPKDLARLHSLRGWVEGRPLISILWQGQDRWQAGPRGQWLKH